jgi:biotin carboxyl carrier protein
VNFDLVVHGRPWKVAVEPGSDPGRFEVTVKGQRRSVDAVWIDAETLSLIDAAAVRDIGIRRIDAGHIEVVFDRKTFEVAVTLREEVGKKKTPDLISGKGTTTIVASMPGRIVRVLVAPGDRIAARQVVVIVEAMKMENELRSPRDGIVKEVMVREGMAIESGIVVVVIE